MGARWIGSWAGGRVREVDGRKVWVIERRIGSGQRKVVTLNVAGERDANAELALFLRDPNAYRTRRESAQVSTGAVRLDDETLKAFGAYVAAEGLSEGYRTQILEKYLAEWGEALGRRDLRTVSLGELQKHLDRWKTARHHRIVALKSLTSWLRETGRLRRAEDPTLDLKVPQARPEKSVRAKGYALSQVERVYAEIPSQLLRDTLCLRAKTGMHDTEIARIARGEAVLKRLDDPSGIAGTITFSHLKAGKIHVVSVDAQTFDAAARIQARGTPLSRNAAKISLDRAVKRLREAEPNAERRKQIPNIHPSELRHSFATWARASGSVVRPTEGGVPLAEIAAVLGHTSARTTKVFYEGNEVPPMVTVPLRLAHPSDPAPFRAPVRNAARRAETV